MHAVLRIAPFALGSMLVWSELCAQTAELPPIFAPQVERKPPERSPALLPARPVPVTSLSGRTRSLMFVAAELTLASMPAIEAPAVGAGKDMAFDAASGATVMSPLYVKAKALRDSDVRPPSPRLYHFTALDGDSLRRVAGGVTAPLYHTFIGNKELQADFNIVNGAGRGIDHGRDFTRVEFSFSLKW